MAAVGKADEDGFDRRRRVVRRRAGLGGAVVALAAAAGLAMPALVGDEAATEVQRAPAADAASPDRSAGAATLPAGCRDVQARADVDGDGRVDTVAMEWPELVLRVCLATGAQHELRDVASGEAFAVVDVEPDGRAEVLYGGTTVAYGGSSVVVLHDGALREVQLGGAPLHLTFGTLGYDEVAQAPTEVHAVGCEDLDADGRRDLVAVVARFTDDATAWTKTAYAIEGATATVVAEDAGEAGAVGPDARSADAFTSPC